MELLFRFRAPDGSAHLGILSMGYWLDLTRLESRMFPDFASLLRRPDWRGTIRELRSVCNKRRECLPVGLRDLLEGSGLGLSEMDPSESSPGGTSEGTGSSLLCPIDHQEVWGAGVTYRRSEEARIDDSKLAPDIYAHVYTATRPEVFFKATARRCVGPGESIRIRSDTASCVPEPELGIVLDSGLQVVGYTIGNDVTARDMEGENPLYLPQAKIWDGSCAIGPAVVLEEAVGEVAQLSISLTVVRDGEVAFEGRVSAAEMVRPIQELIMYLGRANSFPDGVVLLTGTGIVPHETFALNEGDVVEVSIDRLGKLANTVLLAEASSSLAESTVR